MSYGQAKLEAALLRPFDARQLSGQPQRAIHGSRSVSSDLDTFLIFPLPLFYTVPPDHPLILYWNTVMNLAEWTMVPRYVRSQQKG